MRLTPIDLRLREWVPHSGWPISHEELSRDGSPYTVSLVESGGYGPDEETQTLYDLEVVGQPVRENLMPNPRSRAYLGNDCDRFGMPRLVLDWVVGRQETDTLMRLHNLLDAHLRRNELGQLDPSSKDHGELRYTDASHHLGTTRMSSDAREGVVDENCKVHGVANLYISGSGVLPTAGHANPTLTIVALAVRLAEHLKRANRLSKGEEVEQSLRRSVMLTARRP